MTREAGPTDWGDRWEGVADFNDVKGDDRIHVADVTAVRHAPGVVRAPVSRSMPRPGERITVRDHEGNFCDGMIVETFHVVELDRDTFRSE